MIGVSAQVSLYPLGQEDLEPAIRAIWQAMGAHALEYKPGPMSTLTWGDDDAVLEALKDGFRRAVELGPAVLIITLTNACPLPPEYPPAEANS
jgi:uncharacterized protein YqgV (UPF0045/DUF77 family)